MEHVKAKKMTTMQAVDGNRVSAIQWAAVNYATSVAHVIGQAFPDAIVTSVMRSTAVQKVLYERFKAGKGGPAAKPGTSWHEAIMLPEGKCKWALDIDRPGVDPEAWKLDCAGLLQAKGIKFHTMFSEKAPTGWIHIQGLYGGGVEGNPGLIKRL